MPVFTKAHAVLLAVTLALASIAAPARAQSPEPAKSLVSCAQAGAEAERGWNIPGGLLAAIGRAESGRFDAASGRVAAWPWSINAAGQGQQFASREEAILAVRMLQARGVRSIDVGCFQINLMFHPGAFTSLEEAFDPRANAQYAAQFLTTLHDRSPTWDVAVGNYHSATPARGDAYRNRVLANWLSDPAAAAPAPGLPRVLVGRPGAVATPNVWSVSSQALGIRVWSPGRATP